LRARRSDCRGEPRTPLSRHVTFFLILEGAHASPENDRLDGAHSPKSSFSHVSLVPGFARIARKDGRGAQLPAAVARCPRRDPR
jgi:hypothetical protein